MSYGFLCQIKIKLIIIIIIIIILSNATPDVSNQQKADIFLYLVKTPKTHLLLLEVPRDEELISTLLKKYEQLFFCVILPELITRKNCPNEVHDNNKCYCICKRPCFPPMIACSGKNCHIK